MSDDEIFVFVVGRLFKVYLEIVKNINWVIKICYTPPFPFLGKRKTGYIYRVSTVSESQ